MKWPWVAAALPIALCACSGSISTPGPIPSGTGPVATALHDDLAQYLAARGKIEHISAASLSVSLPTRAWIDVAAGTTSYGGKTLVTPSNLFQIGSNTKAFTAVVILKLEAEHKLTTNQRLADWLPQYASWKSVTIRQLLDMTSGIATYDGTRAWEDAFAADPYHDFSPRELIAYIDQKKPLQPGWLYSNTGYQLSQLIADKASGNAYTNVLRNDVIAEAGLNSTYFYANIYPVSLRKRTVDGYYYDTGPTAGGLKPIVGKNVRNYSLSWAQAAGGVVSTPHDLARWARDLYQGSILTPSQRAELETLVSTTTGKHIARATAGDPRGFGLGVSQVYKPEFGRFWFYEGETLGYRMVHAYFPSRDLVIAVGLNSQARPDEDQIGLLVVSIYKTLEAHGLI
jgi:D-alanyl-D-alanine carboxypeptidase